MRTSLVAPSLMGEAGSIRFSTVDGKLVLFNGQNWTKAMQLVSEKVLKMTEEEKGEAVVAIPHLEQTAVIRV